MANPIDIRTNDPAEITLTTQRKQGITMEVSGGAGGDPYEGDYEVTPSEETQVLRTAQKRTPGRRFLSHSQRDGKTMTS